MTAGYELQKVPERAISPQARRYREGTWRATWYRDALVRGRWVQIFFGLLAFTAVGGVVFAIEGIDLAARSDSGEVVTQSAFDEWARAMSGVSGAYVLIEIALVVAFLAWLWRIVANLPALAGGVPSRSPAASIGWWFVPIVDLVMPYLVLREVWARYATPSRQGSNGLVVAWWLLFIVATTGSSLAGGWWPYSREIRLAGGDVLPLAAFLGAYVLTVVMCFMGIALVRDVQERAEQRVAALGLQVKPIVFAGPVPWGAPRSGVGGVAWHNPTYPYPPQGYPPQAYPAQPQAGPWPPARPQPQAGPWPPAGQWPPVPWPPAGSWPPAPAAPDPSAWSRPAPATEATAQAAEAAAPPPHTESHLTATPGDCPACGAPHAAGVRYCAACGTRLA